MSVLLFPKSLDIASPSFVSVLLFIIFAKINFWTSVKFYLFLNIRCFSVTQKYRASKFSTNEHFLHLKSVKKLPRSFISIISAFRLLSVTFQIWTVQCMIDECVLSPHIEIKKVNEHVALSSKGVMDGLQV